jgi:hypothetical protein
VTAGSSPYLARLRHVGLEHCDVLVLGEVGECHHNRGRTIPNSERRPSDIAHMGKMVA